MSCDDSKPHAMHSTGTMSPSLSMLSLFVSVRKHTRPTLCVNKIVVANDSFSRFRSIARRSNLRRHKHVGHVARGRDSQGNTPIHGICPKLETFTIRVSH